MAIHWLIYALWTNLPGKFKNERERKPEGWSIAVYLLVCFDASMLIGRRRYSPSQ